MYTYDGQRRTPGLRQKLAVFVDDLKHIGYCLNLGHHIIVSWEVLHYGIVWSAFN